ncbi:MAG TPA: hypothetical protein VEK15_21145 [Vicinamibacteria bacterium]|nr:hypothetical protein [Vicinamibacteria bacterium]
MDPSCSVLVMLPIVFGLVQPLSQLPESRKMSLAVLYSSATAAFVASLLWRNDPSVDTWPAFLQLFDFSAPAFMFAPAALTLVGVARSVDRGINTSGRIYLLGGLLLCLMIIGRIWYGAIELWFPSVVGGGIGAMTAAVFSYPIALILSMLSVCFGILPSAVRPGLPWSVSYLCGVALLSVHAHVAVSRSQQFLPELLVPGLLLVSPSFLVAIYRLCFSRTNSQHTGVV